MAAKSLGAKDLSKIVPISTEIVRDKMFDKYLR